jgi:hypothetical protein
MPLLLRSKTDNSPVTRTLAKGARGGKRDHTKNGGPQVVRDKAFAKEASELLLEYANRLDGSVAQARTICSDAEFEAYRRAVGEVMGQMWDQLLSPIFAAHPDLKPKDLS